MFNLNNSRFIFMRLFVEYIKIQKKKSVYFSFRLNIIKFNINRYYMLQHTSLGWWWWLKFMVIWLVQNGRYRKILNR